MADQPTSDADTPATGASGSRRRFALSSRLSIAQSAFLLSVTLALINTFYAIRGAEIVVQPPEQILLYRDGDGDDAVLTFAMRIAMINAADSAHGDVMMKASVTPIAGGPSFAFANEVLPVFTSDPQAASKCGIDMRCISLPGLLAMEKSDQIFDIPGGQVRGRYLSYPAVKWNCTGSDTACARFGNFPGALATLSGKPLDVIVRLEFYGDGTRTLRCKAKAVDAKYLATNGWMSMGCSDASVSGAPLL